MPSQLSLFYATSLEISQIARWVRASPENTLSGLPVVNDPGELMLKDDGMALCLYDDTMKMWSTVGDLIPQWCEMGRRIAEAIEKNPTIQTSWGKDHLNTVGYESLQNFREDMWVEENGSVRPIPSPFLLAHNLDEEVKRLEAAYINLPGDEDEDEARLPYSPLSSVSDSVTTPPLSPCSPFESPDSLFSPFSLPCSYSYPQTISPHEIFDPLPQEEDHPANAFVMEELQVPAAPTVPVQSLPEELADVPVETSPIPSTTPSTPAAGPSTFPLKRSRWSGDESGDETDEFAPQMHKKTRTKKRSKTKTVNRASAKFGGKGVDCDLCGKHLGRVTDLPRHKVSCEENPERATRHTPCEVCGKLLPVRADAIKRHLASKTCRAKRKKSSDERPHLLES